MVVVMVVMVGSVVNKKTGKGYECDLALVDPLVLLVRVQDGQTPD